jgi:hypothetical protein
VISGSGNTASGDKNCRTENGDQLRRATTDSS